MVAERIARTRISRIKFKSGGEIRVLPNRYDERPGRVAERLKSMLDDVQRTLGGYVIVLWDGAGYSNTAVAVWHESQISTVLVPDYVKGLVAEEIMERRIKD